MKEIEEGSKVIVVKGQHEGKEGILIQNWDDSISRIDLGDAYIDVDSSFLKVVGEPSLIKCTLDLRKLRDKSVVEAYKDFAYNIAGRNICLYLEPVANGVEVVEFGIEYDEHGDRIKYHSHEVNIIYPEFDEEEMIDAYMQKVMVVYGDSDCDLNRYREKLKEVLRNVKLKNF